MRATTAVGVAITLALSLGAADARADEADPETRLWAQSENARLWYYGWSTLFGVATFEQITQATSASDRDARAPAVVGSITSGLAFVSTVAIRPVSGFAHYDLRAMPNGTREEQAARRAEAKRLLEKAAAEQRLGKSWIAHTAGLAINLAAGLVLWRGYGLFGPGAFAFVGGTVISEAKIATQPGQLMDVGVTPAGAGLSVRGAF